MRRPWNGANDVTESHRYPRFSFLTTAYMTESYLAETIESVLAQSSPDWELVVVDNGNSNAMAAIVKFYANDSRIKLIRQVNQGYAGGFMAAAAVASGAYVCPLASDDLLMPDYVETMGKFLDAHPEVDAVGCDAYMFFDGEQRSFGRGYLRSIGEKAPPIGGERLTVNDVLGGRVPYYGGAIRREAWDAVGGYAPGVPDVEVDVLSWLRLALDFHVHLLPNRLARCRVRADSVSRHPQNRENFERRMIGTFEGFATASGRPEHLVAVEPMLRRFKYHQALRRARWSLLEGDISSARRFSREAYAQKHTFRAAIAICLLTLSPRLLIAVHPLKQHIAAWGRRIHPAHRRRPRRATG